MQNDNDQRLEKMPNFQNSNQNQNNDWIAVLVIVVLLLSIVSSSPSLQNATDTNDSVKNKKIGHIDTMQKQTIEHGAYSIDSFAQQLFGVKQR